MFIGIAVALLLLGILFALLMETWWIRAFVLLSEIGLSIFCLWMAVVAYRLSPRVRY